ncbi:MAG: SUMF1/EgtB/PvdO family nonheme iron enzyme, partial [Bacteroidia bacterium]
MNRGLIIEPDDNGKAYLVVIGIDNYQDKAIGKLENAKRDAEDVLTLLTTEFQLESRGEFVLLDEAASLENIYALFEKLTKHPNKFFAPNDSLVIYLAGHGTMKNNRGYFLPVDAQHGKTHSYFPHSELREYIKEIPALHTFLVMDSCFSGAIFRNLEEWDAFSAGKEQLPSCIVFASGLLEKVEDGFRNGNSPFAKAFLHYLRHETQHQAHIPIGDLIRFVEKEVRNQGHTQQPYADRLPQSQDKKGELVLYRKGKQNPEQKLENTLERLYQQQDVIGLTAFIKANKGKFRQTALTYLEQIEAQTAFEKLKEKPSKNLCNAFLQKYEDNPAEYFTSLVAQVEQILEDLLEMPSAFVPEKKPISSIKVPPPKVSTLPPILQQLEANMVFIEGGTFDMGSEEGRDNEKPVHKVNLSDFYMCKYQLSQKEWQFVMG